MIEPIEQLNVSLLQKRLELLRESHDNQRYQTPAIRKPASAAALNEYNNAEIKRVIRKSMPSPRK